MADRGYLPPLFGQKPPINWWRSLRDTVNSLVKQEGIPPRWAEMLVGQDGGVVGMTVTSTQEYFIPLPNGWEDGSNVWLNIYWSRFGGGVTTSSSGDVSWTYRYRFASPGSVFPGYSLNQTMSAVTQLYSGAILQQYESEIDASGQDQNDILNIRLWPGGVAGGWTGQVYLYTTAMLYPRVANGSVNRYSKLPTES